MYASADTGGNSSFYWRLLDGLPMIGPLPTETHTHASTHVKYLLPVGATTAEKLEATSRAVAADRLASVFQSRPAVTRRGPRPRPQNFGLETKTAVSRTTHPPSLSSSAPFPSPVVAAPIFHPFHSLPSTLLSFSRYVQRRGLVCFLRCPARRNESQSQKLEGTKHTWSPPDCNKN